MKERKMTRVVVTGASGFIGTHLVNTLTAQGIEVYATDRYPPVHPLPCARFIEADLLDDAAISPLFEGADTVFHLAAIASIAREERDEYTRVNVDGSAKVRSLAEKHRVQKIVHMSSSTVYGIPESCPLSEDSPIQPKNPYGQSKALAEAAISRQQEYPIEVAIIRPRVVVGKGRAGIFALLFTALEKGLPIPLFGGGKNRFQFTAVDDLISGTLLAARENSGGENQIYNIGSDVLHTVREEMEALAEVAKSSSRFLSIPTKPLENTLGFLHRIRVSPLVPEQYQIASADFVLDTRKAKERLGFSPKSANREGIVEAWHWWKEQKRPKGFRAMMDLWQPRYQNSLQRRDKR